MFRDDIVVETVLEAGESYAETYQIAGNATEIDGGCPSPGTYRLESEYGANGTWGFEIEIQ